MSDRVRLLPGNSCTARLFDPVRDTAFGDRICEEVDFSQCATFNAMVDEALSAAKDKVILCGVSMGGMVALAAALLRPERVAGLILIATSAQGPDSAERRWRERIFAADPKDAFARFVERIPQAWFYDASRTALIARQMQSDAQGLGQEVFLRQQRCLAERPDMVGRLADIRCPTLVIHGHDDRVLPHPQSRSLHRAIQGSRYRLVARCGHLPTLEKPVLTASAIATWLKRAPIA